jgi:hypothetical protein
MGQPMAAFAAVPETNADLPVSQQGVGQIHQQMPDMLHPSPQAPVVQPPVLQPVPMPAPEFVAPPTIPPGTAPSPMSVFSGAAPPVRPLPPLEGGAMQPQAQPQPPPQVQAQPRQPAPVRPLPNYDKLPPNIAASLQRLAGGPPPARAPEKADDAAE